MSKRLSNGATDLADPSRPKRARVGATEAGTSDGDVYMSDHEGTDAEDDGGEHGRATRPPMTPEEVRIHGLTLLQTLKDAVSKDGRPLAPPFLRKVPKRHYPDYYVIIQHPIAFEDIKSKLDKGVYPTLEAVRQDFELCFNNAMTYNLSESQLWKDAKDLLKLTNKTYSKIVPSENGEKKSKPPSLTRMLKSRLQKLVDKKDETGRPISTEFMELPSRKLWPDYYKTIKKPQCFNNIFKRLKRKEFSTSEEFANEVELIFSNAMFFNQDHTPIWEDALTLRNTFRQLMSDLPPQYALPQYTQPTTKIKIKPPAAQASSSGHTPSLTLRVPAATPASKPSLPPPTLPVARNTAAPRPEPTRSPVVAPTPAPAPPPPVAKAPSPKLPVMKVTATPKPAPSPRTVATPVKQATPLPAPAPYATTSFIHTPAPAPVHVAPPPAPPVVAEIPVAPSVPAAVPAAPPAPSPAPAISNQHQLKCAKVEIQPRGRVVWLDHKDGVRSWAIRLGPGESRIILNNVMFLNQHDDDDGTSEEEEEEDEGDDDMDVDHSPGRNGKVRKEKGKRRRGRPPTRASARQANLKSAKSKDSPSKPGELQVKVNNLVIKEQPETTGEWDIHLPVGQSVLEVGESGGLVWKLYIDRMGTV